MSLNRIAVVGAGLAGVSACDALRARGYDGELVLYCSERGLPYDRPPLSKDVLLGRASRAHISLRPEQWYEKQRVELRDGTTVRAIRMDEGGLELDDGSVRPADRVVLATGGVPRPLPVPGGDAPAVHLLRTWEDAERLRDRLLPGAEVVVIGAGLIGAETAAVAKTLGCAVTLVDPVPLPLAAVVGQEIAGALHQRHSAEGIEVRTSGVKRVESQGDGKVWVLLSEQGRLLAADTVVAGIGIRPSTALAETAGLAVDNGIVVSPGGQTSHPHVYAIGDVARVQGHGRHEHWEAAQRDGETAAYALLGRAVPSFGAPWFWSDRHGSRLEVIGTMTDAEYAVVRGKRENGAFTVFGLIGDRVVAAAAIDRPRDIQVARRLVDRGITAHHTFLTDEDTNLRALLGH